MLYFIIPTTAIIEAQNAYRRAMYLVYERMKLVIEPSAAVPLAVVLYSDSFRQSLVGIAERRGKSVGNELNICLVFSGGNVDLKSIGTIFSQLT